MGVHFHAAEGFSNSLGDLPLFFWGHQDPNQSGCKSTGPSASSSDISVFSLHFQFFTKVLALVYSHGIPIVRYLGSFQGRTHSAWALLDTVISDCPGDLVYLSPEFLWNGLIFCRQIRPECCVFFCFSPWRPFRLSDLTSLSISPGVVHLSALVVAMNALVTLWDLLAWIHAFPPAFLPYLLHRLEMKGFLAIFITLDCPKWMFLTVLVNFLTVALWTLKHPWI